MTSLPEFFRYLLTEPPTAHADSAQTPSTLEIPADPVDFARNLLYFHPDPAQIPILRATTQNAILNCARQSGKSTLIAILALHRALTQPRSLVLIVAPAQRQSSELLEKIENFLPLIGLEDLTGDGKNRHSLRFPNNSRIVALPGTKPGKIRGFSACNMLILDEAGQIDDRVLSVVSPMLAVSKGNLWIASTPMGRRGFFYDIWSDTTDPTWTKVSITAADNPRIGQEFLERERIRMTDSEYRQEYCCEFVDADAPMFRLETILRAIKPDLNTAW
jgi:hypothetical protein